MSSEFSDSQSVTEDSRDKVPRIGDTLTAWGHTFQWSALHQTHEQYRSLKFTYDRLAEECVIEIEALQEQTDAETVPKLDSYTFLRENHERNGKLSELWNEVTNVPSWVNWEQIARGQDVLYRYGPALSMGLACQSLLGGTGRSGDIAVTLSKTGGFSIKTARRRILETTQFVLQVTQSLAAIQPHGDGFVTAVRVRLLHAKVRRRILNLASSRPSYYDTAQYGIPINDMDSIVTIHSFSSMLIWSALPRQGIYLRRQEIEDYLALWRLVAHYMGTPTATLASPALAKATMDSIQLYEFRPTETSKQLARNIVRGLENQPPLYPSRALIEVLARWLNGNELCDAFDMPRPSMAYWLLAAGQCLLFAGTTYTCRSFGPLDRWQLRHGRQALWELVLEGKQMHAEHMSKFELQYVPEYGMGEGKEKDFAERRPAVWWTADRKALLIIFTPVVSFALLAWLTACVVAPVANHSLRVMDIF